jgi:ankyrin repeat protein
MVQPPAVVLNCPHAHTFHKKCFDIFTQLDKENITCPQCHLVGVRGSPLADTVLIKIHTLGCSVLRIPSKKSLTEKIFDKALEEEETAVIEFLLKRGVSPATFIDGKTPLYIACKKGNVPLARLLIQFGANPRIKNDLSARGELDNYWFLNDFGHDHAAVPLRAAVDIGHLGLVKLLQNRAQAPIDEPDRFGRTPLFSAVFKKQEEIALYLIGEGVSLDVIDRFGLSLLWMAVRTQSLRIVRELVQRGISPATVLKKGMTCVYVAAETDNPKVLCYLLRHGGKKVINTLWLDKWTPISMAVQCGHLKNVHILVKSGADLSLTYDGKTLLELAPNRNRKLIVRYLHSRLCLPPNNKSFKEKR